MRYSEVKERDERRPSAIIMDLANQPKVSQRVNGWKTHLISAEITEMVTFTRMQLLVGNKTFFSCVRSTLSQLKWKN